MERNLYNLSKTELIFKNAFQNMPERELKKPHNREEIQDILDKASAVSPDIAKQEYFELLNEKAFIYEGLDISFHDHERYMPPFWHSHDLFEIMYLKDGEITHYINNTSYTMRAGDVCIVLPHIEHAVSAFSDNVRLHYILVRPSTFETMFTTMLDDGSVLMNFLKNSLYFDNGEPYWLFHTHLDPELSYIFDLIQHELYRRKRYKRQILDNMLSGFILTLFRNHEGDMHLPYIETETSDQNLIYIMKYMQMHYQTITLSELAQFFNYSERQLQRILKKATGMSFTENIQSQKLAKAENLLTTSTLSIEEICDVIGFNSLNNFRAIFKRKFDMTPGEYRKQNSKIKKRKR
ncbi:MAG: AraC family transcriptional regulator [Lachnospiraceae bacterium]|nr:AraC family transcriptional regulator [Lachnospiraceae bacterium]